MHEQLNSETMSQNMEQNKRVVSVTRDSDGIVDRIEWSFGKDKTVMETSELRKAQLMVLRSSLERKRGFLRELLTQVELELDDFEAIRYLEDKIAGCFEEEDYYYLEHYKAEILDIIMHTLGLCTYESGHGKTKEQTKTDKR